MIQIQIAGTDREMWINPERIVKVYTAENGLTIIQLDVYDPAEQKWEEIATEDSMDYVIGAIKNGIENYRR